jgi:hypothetical protein
LPIRLGKLKERLGCKVSRPELLLKSLSRRGASAEAIAKNILRHPELMESAIKGLSNENPRVKYGCLKVLRLISEQRPQLHYSRIDDFIDLLDSENNFLKWGGMIIVSNLAGVDQEGRIDRILARYLRPISGHILISAANVIGGAGRIALAKPRLADRIAAQVLKVEQAAYQTPECRNVAIGGAIDAFDPDVPAPQASIAAGDAVRPAPAQ